jgi:hypothetical protein
MDISDGGIKEQTPQGKCFRSWPAATHESADASMEKVTKYFAEQALPVLDRTQTAQGLKAELDSIHQRDLRGGKDLNHHRYFERACCAARLHDYATALVLLHRAVDLYAADGRDWCEGYASSCRELIAAIKQEEADALLERWINESMVHLRLAEIAGK